MIRPSDVIFVILAVVVVAMLSLHMAVIVFALVGAFACGSLYVFAGMVPPRTESFGTRVFVSVFLAVVAASIADTAGHPRPAPARYGEAGAHHRGAAAARCLLLRGPAHARHLRGVLAVAREALAERMSRKSGRWFSERTCAKRTCAM
jgi:hypothetical protein